MSCIVEPSLLSISNNNDYKEKKNVTLIELLVCVQCYKQIMIKKKMKPTHNLLFIQCNLNYP